MNRSDARRRLVGAALAAAALGGLAPAAHAQAWPSKPIRLLIPFTPGGGTDFVARTVGTKLAENTGWQIVMENRPGAAGNIAIEAAAKSAPDGYTIVMGQSDNMMLGPWLYPNVGYDSVKSFAPIVQVSVAPMVIAASAANTRINGPADLIAAGRSGNGITWATAGNGSLGHLFGEQLRAATGMKLTQVHYKGAAPAMTDVIGGTVDVTILSSGSVLPQIRGGKLKPVAVTTARRAPVLPDTQTIEEGGPKGFDASIWLGLFAPVGTPPEVVARINAEVNRVLQAPDIREKLAAQGIAPAGGTSEAFGAFVREDYARWGKVVRDSGVKAE
ncbi:MAG TPA: tripartite tricarboxylate transporter substrate binding protein [Burkholderiaceae bacterium]|nr:tripartite tricarboxylate transporter substrate binding protein [Burkholderiaceae bacterium]